MLIKKSEKYSDCFDILALVLVLFAHIALRTGDKVVIMGIIGVTVFCYAILRFLAIIKRYKIVQSDFFIWINLFMIICTIYGLYRNWDATAFSIQYHLFFWASILSSYILIYNRSNDNLFRILNLTFSITLFIFICYLAVNGLSDIGNDDFRLGSDSVASGNSNSVAMSIGLLSSFLYYGLIIEDKKQYLIPCILVFMFSMLTGSKKGLMIFVMYFVMFNLYKTRNKVNAIIKVSLISLLAFFLITNVEYLYNHVGFRVIDFLTEIGLIDYGQQSNSTYLRLLMYDLGIRAFLDNPFFGGGWFYFSHYSKLGTYSHNNYIELLVTFGLFGFTLYYMYIARSLLYLSLTKKYIGSNNVYYFLTTIIIIIFLQTAAVSFYNDYIQYLIFGAASVFIKNCQFGIHRGVSCQKFQH